MHQHRLDPVRYFNRCRLMFFLLLLGLLLFILFILFVIINLLEQEISERQCLVQRILCFFVFSVDEITVLAPNLSQSH